MKKSEIFETLVILVALVSLMPVAYWWHMDELGQHMPYMYYLFAMLCLLGYVTYRRIKKLRAVLRASKKDDSKPDTKPDSGPKIPPFYQS
ncbi:hypothetical protein GF312_18835 [Candidatus Poribacteria bacterium]|nr:hypothetical protein [Candidatus Poribacteria bacterium]